MDILYIGYGLAIGIVITTIVWYFVDLRLNNELEDELEDTIEELEQYKAMHAALLKDNKRMLAALNHYQIKGYTGENGKWIRSR